jgi:SAM-dependent methyltransferase
MMIQPRQVEDLSECFFYHTMDLPGIGEVKGHWDLRKSFDKYIGGVELEGKTIIDIGTATGFLSFEAEKRGASRVVSFDIGNANEQSFLPFRNKLYSQDRAQWAEQYGKEIEQWKNAYWLCHRLLGSKAEVFYGNVYEIPLTLGQFDVAIVGSVLEHLSDQISALASIARVTKKMMVIVSPVLRTDERIARFEALGDHPENDFTWWTYSEGVYREVFKMLGFKITAITENQFYYHYGERFETRSTIVAEREEE